MVGIGPTEIQDVPGVGDNVEAEGWFGDRTLDTFLCADMLVCFMP